MIFSAISADELQYFRFFDRNHYFTMQSFHLLFLWKIGHRKFWEHGRLCIWNQLARVSHRTAKKCDPIDLKYAEVPLLPWFWSSNFKVGNIYQGKFFEVVKWWIKFTYSIFFSFWGQFIRITRYSKHLLWNEQQILITYRICDDKYLFIFNHSSFKCLLHVLVYKPAELF